MILDVSSSAEAKLFQGQQGAMLHPCFAFLQVHAMVELVTFCPCEGMQLGELSNPFRKTNEE